MPEERAMRIKEEIKDATFYQYVAFVDYVSEKSGSGRKASNS